MSPEGVMGAAARALRARLPELTERLVREFSDGEGLVLTDDARDLVRRLCHEGLRAALGALERPRGDRPDLRLASDAGTLWAGRGLRLDSLLRLYRLAGRLVWESLLQAAGPSGATTLVYQVGGVLRGIDQESTAATTSYLQEESRLLPLGRARVVAAIDTLLSMRPVPTAEVEAAAAILELPLRGRYAVAVHRPGASPPLVAPRGVSAQRGMRFFWRHQRVLVFVDKADLDDVEAVLKTQATGHMGIGQLVDGLAGLERSARGAELALRTCRDAGPQVARFDRRIPHGLLAGQPALAAELVHEILGGVLALPLQYRRALLDTLETWLRCDGSATAAARALYCHRNTVLHRLRRLQDLSHRSLGKPNDLVDLALALHAYRSTEIATTVPAAPAGVTPNDPAPESATPRPGEETRPRTLAVVGQPMIERTSGA